ncbi:MAG: hypothetical protein Q4F97_07825 [Bacteroidales bacterium]|nr:hypothetical protein [Bacteroidales bacterium]
MKEAEGKKKPATKAKNKHDHVPAYLKNDNEAGDNSTAKTHAAK